MPAASRAVLIAIKVLTLLAGTPSANSILRIVATPMPDSLAKESADQRSSALAARI